MRSAAIETIHGLPSWRSRQSTPQLITLDEDNYYPTAAITSSPTITGSQFVIQGSATDQGTGYGTVSDFSKMIVFIEDGSGQIFNMKSKGSYGAKTSVPVSGGTADFTTTASCFMNINTTLENNSLPTSGGTDTNNDGFMENLSIAGSSYSWMGQFDSTQIPDGTVYVHYIVFDQAGNASSYIQTAFVSNFAPSLASVTLGTDMNGNGQITGVTDSNSSPVETTAFSSGYTATNFVRPQQPAVLRGDLDIQREWR